MKNQKLETAIAAVAQKQKECRKTLLRHFAFLCLAILIFALPTLPFVRDLALWTAAKFLDEICFFIAFFTWILTAICWIKIHIKYLTKLKLKIQYDYLIFYKNTFIKAVIYEFGLNLSYKPKVGIDKDTFNKSKIYGKSKFYSEDTVGGVYNGVNFSLSEVISLDPEIADSDNIYVQFALTAYYVYKKVADFRGTVLVCEFYKNFKGQTILADKKAPNTKISCKKELLDDIEFNDEFRVFTDDKIEARYLLSPGFMRRLREVKQGFDGVASLSAAFMDDKFYLFLNGAKDRFESSLFGPPPNLSDAQAVKDEISRLLRVIDELNLSLDIYK